MRGFVHCALDSSAGLISRRVERSGNQCETLCCHCSLSVSRASLSALQHALTGAVAVWIDGQRRRSELLERSRLDHQGVEGLQAVDAHHKPERKASGHPLFGDDLERAHLSRCLKQPEPELEPESEQPQGAPRISLEAEVPEALFDGMKAFLSNRPDWDQYRVITSALAGFLFQNGCSDQSVTQHYLNGLFVSAAES